MRPSWCWGKFSISLGKYARGNKRHQGLVRPSTLFVCSLLLGSNQPLTFLNSFHHFFLVAFIHSFLHSFPLIFLLSFLPCFFHSHIHSFLFSFIYSSISSFFHSSSYSFLPSFLSSIYPSFLLSFLLSNIPSFHISILFLQSFLLSTTLSFHFFFLNIFHVTSHSFKGMRRSGSTTIVTGKQISIDLDTRRKPSDILHRYILYSY